MSTPINPIEPFTPFLPSTYDTPNEEDRLYVFLVEKLSGFADVINDKKIGVYTQTVQNLNGEKWIYLTTQKVRSGYQIMVYVPRFTNGLTIPNPIPSVNPQMVITHTWGSASLPCTAVGAGNGDYFSFFPRGDARIGYTLSDTQIVISTDGNRSGYSGFIIIEYVRDGF